MSQGAGILPPRVSQTASDTRDFESLVGTVLAERYRIDRLLGVGAMGAVFRGHQLTLKRDVAIKVLHADLSGNSEIAARFKREAQSAARLEHPNIVQVLEYGSTIAGHSFIAMQLLEGHELNQMLGQPIPARRAVALILQVLSGLEHAHEHDVVHRDLKPENVFVTRDHEGKENLKLVDFGISKMSDSDDGNRNVTRAGLVFGTPLYMSPEQATGSNVDARADLYSTGVILYEMLAGKPPFDHDDPVALIRMQVSVDPPRLDTSVPPRLAKIVYKLLAKDRAQRYSSAAEARIALESAVTLFDSVEEEPGDSTETIASGSGSGRSPVGAVRMTVPPPQRRSRLIAALIFASGTGVLGFLVWAALPQIELTNDTVSAGTGTGDLVVEAGSAVTPEEFAAIDRRLIAKQQDEALLLIKPLRDQNPDDAQLLWREGRALALRRSKRATALNRYAQALENEPTLIDEPIFLAELYALLGESRLREAALDFAVQKLGEHGHRFLLGLVNETNPDKSLSFTDRHRALAELRQHEDSAKLIDNKLNLARDLWQAKNSPAPCENFRTALQRVAELDPPDDYFMGPLDVAKVPRSRKDEADATYCGGLEEALVEARAQLADALRPDTTGGTTDAGAETDGDTPTAIGSQRAGVDPSTDSAGSSPTRSRSKKGKRQPKSEKTTAARPPGRNAGNHRSQSGVDRSGDG